MKHRLQVSSAAHNDLEEICFWYEFHDPDLKMRFLNAVNEIINQILLYPASCPVVYKYYRRGVVSGFPYNVLFKVDKDTIKIVSISHHNRSPSVLKKRADER